MPKPEPARFSPACRAFRVLALMAGTGLLLPAVAQAADARLDGEADYRRVCADCHAKGANKNKLSKGAPRVGDRIAWESRVRKGVDTLYRIVMDNPLHGKSDDPAWADVNPFIWRDNLTDDQIRAALAFMFAESR